MPDDKDRGARLRDRVPKEMDKGQPKGIRKIPKNYHSNSRGLGTSSEKLSSKGASLLRRTVRRLTADTAPKGRAKP